MTWKFHVENLIRFGELGYKLYAMRGQPDGGYEVFYNPTVQYVESGHSFDLEKCFLTDSYPGMDVKAFLQAASDAAWEIGIRPKQIEDNSNELKATKYHLEDMRKLAGAK